MKYDKSTVEKVTRLVIDNLEALMLEEINISEDKVPVGISARHVHLERQHLDILFGKDYQLTFLKALSQPGQFAAQETVEIIGPKGALSSVRILGPERKQTQVEVAMTEARKLGIKPLVRTSGELSGTPGITIRGPKGEITIQEGVIIADRHIHMTPEDARRYDVKEGQKVKVQIDGEKGGIMHNVTIRVSDKYALDCHIDTDDASAFLISQGQIVTIVRE
jgi:putative phosphotransacetylase